MFNKYCHHIPLTKKTMKTTKKTLTNIKLNISKKYKQNTTIKINQQTLK